jgi:hypothetical protein
MNRVLGFVLLIVASLLVGFYLGTVWSRRRFSEGSRILSQVLALKEYETLADLQYKESNPAQGKEAFLGLLAFMDKMATEKGIVPSMQRGLDLDRGIAYMRLALLEDREGNKDQSDEYIRQAQACLKKTDMKDLSEGHLREVVSQLDATTHYMLPYTLTFTKAVQ